MIIIPFFESVLEPLSIQWSLEFTSKIFSQRELDFGNEIAFISDRLSYMSVNSKVRMFTALKELGIINKESTANIFNLPIPPDKDTYLQSLNYVDTKIVNEYQLGEQKAGGEEEDDKTKQ